MRTRYIHTIALALAVGAVILAAGSSVAQESQPTSQPAAQAAVAQDQWGEHEHRMCVVCDLPRATAQTSDMHRGVVIPVCDRCAGAYAANREAYFASLQPRAALFSDEYATRHPLSWTSFALGAYLTVGLVCAAAAGGIAARRGHPAARFIFAGLFGLVLGPAWALMQPQRESVFGFQGMKERATSAPGVCPNCQAAVHPAAAVCQGCGTDLQPQKVSEVSAVRPA